jgi:LmbE family N-acetylglucosaminyl deacetylase
MNCSDADETQQINAASHHAWPDHNLRTLVFSPHLDDGVFSCGELIAGLSDVIIATAFTGAPPADLQLSDWDRRCGFRSSKQAMEVRRDEDRLAAQQLNAQTLHLGQLDNQYGASPCVAALASLLECCIVEVDPQQILFPLGLFHSDHILLREACIGIRAQHPARAWIAYEDAIYRTHEGLVDAALQRLRGCGHWSALPPARRAAARKRSAVLAYASQLRGLGADALNKIALPEAYWMAPVRQGRGLPQPTRARTSSIAT